MRNYNLQLFGDTAEGSSDGSVVGAVVDAQQKRSKSNPLADVQYGIQTDGQADADINEGESKATFKELIDGDYKEDYEKSVQSIVQKRLKGVNSKLQNAQEQLASYTKLIDAMKSHYGDISPDEMANAFLNDNSMLESEALERGIDVETLKEIKQLRFKAQQYEAVQREYQHEQQMKQQFAKLQEEAAEIQKIYPNFNLESELSNDDFVRLIANNIPARTAFEAVHRDEIQPVMMQYVAKQAENKVARAVASNSRRPAENGLGNNSATTIKTDPSQFTKEDRAEIRRRVARGERIVL